MRGRSEPKCEGRPYRDPKFTVASTGPSSLCKPGDVAFTVTSSGDGNTLQVEVSIKPGFPAGVRRDAAARPGAVSSRASSGQAATRLVRRDRLAVDAIKLDVSITDIDLQDDLVIGCKKFDPSRAAKVALPLARAAGR